MLDKEQEPLGLVIKGLLFIEHFLGVIIKNKLKYPDIILKNSNFTFSMKLDILRSHNYLDDKQYNDIKHITRLRNKYAHNLYYDLKNFDVSVFSYCEDYHTYVKPQTPKFKMGSKFVERIFSQHF